MVLGLDQVEEKGRRAMLGEMSNEYKQEIGTEEERERYIYIHKHFVQEDYTATLSCARFPDRYYTYIYIATSYMTPQNQN